WVAFSSDRGDLEHHAIYRLSLSGGVPERVSQPPDGDDRQPVYSPDGRWIAFRSTRAGTSDLYVRPAEPSNQARRVTHMAGPVYAPDGLSDGSGLLYTGQERVEFQSYLTRFHADSLPAEVEAAPESRPVASLTSDVVVAGGLGTPRASGTYTGP